MTWKYIPYSMYNNVDNGGYYSLRKLMSYNCNINIIIGARGFGKTFAVKKFCINKYLQNKEYFAWIRDTEEAKRELCNMKGTKFFQDVPLMKLKDYKQGLINKGEFIINGGRCGEVLPASTFQRYKGNSFQLIKNIVYDEFIREKGRYTKNTTWETVNTFSTIARSREDVRIFLTANALDRGDPFLEFLGVEIKDFGFYVNREKGVCLHYADSSARFNEINSKGIIGKLIIDTPLQSNLMDSKFLNKGDLFFVDLPPKAKILLILESNFQKCRIYTANNKLYVTPDVNPDTYKNKRYVVDVANAERWKPVLSLENKKKLKDHLQNNNILFQSTFLQKFLIDILK